MNAFRVATYVHSTGRTYVRSALAQRRGALEAEHDGIPCGHPGALFHYRLSTHGRKDGRPRARNRYAGYCYYCGYAVGVNEGCIEKSNGQWVVFC